MTFEMISIFQIVPDFYQFVSNPKKTKTFSNDTDIFEKLKRKDEKVINVLALFDEKKNIYYLLSH